ncbi:LysM peptidoglycan-binding domain-containing protein [Gemmobacter straminiformis]|uniref:LysM peptidoglycan-binding domain-containing protein n=2 Tax=Paragemmobacter straminiformis TaxID=2045119 RepID=A0A842I748_9RHOB|nr:LysM peptidoglycan-binding domain-containing protein [Gemmobacter straminiformis]
MASNVTVDSISYTADGDVRLAGRGLGGSVVRVYLDNRQVGDGLIDAAGSWGLTLIGIEPGIYTLRVDQLDGSGTVTSRFETPFKRETVEALAAAAEAATAAAEPAADGAATDGTGANGTGTDGTAADATGGEAEGAGASAAATAEGPVSVTVQPGFTLWRIARETMGEGVMYVQVFEANKAQIRDPNLIYPGQVFTIPKP